MPDYPFLPASRARRNAVEWAWLALVVLLCATMAGYSVWTERALTLAANVERMRMLTLDIDAHLQQQLGGVRNALQSARAAFLPEGSCTLQCRQMLLHSLKMTMPGATALLVVDRQGRTEMSAIMREVDTVARLGGDEFVILLEDLGEEFTDAVGHAELVAQKVLNALNLGYTLGGHELQSTPSIGVVMFGSSGHTVDDLLRQADMAMYEAKAGGRNTCRFFDPCMQQARSDTAAMEADLRCLMASSKWHTAGGDWTATPGTTRHTSARVGL